MKYVLVFLVVVFAVCANVRAGEIVGATSTYHMDRTGPLPMAMLCRASYPGVAEIRVATLADLEASSLTHIPGLDPGAVAWIFPSAPEQIGTTTHDCLAGTSQLSNHYGWSVTDNGYPALVRCGRLAYVACAR